MLSGTDLAQARALQESIMTDVGVIERPIPATDDDFDPVTNEIVQRWEEVWFGKGRTQAQNRDSTTFAVGEQNLEVQAYACAVPWTVTEIHTGDRWRVTASADPGLVGKSFPITTVQASTFVTCRRFIAIDNQG